MSIKSIESVPVSPGHIDDNPGSLELLSTALAHDNLAIFTAEDPEEGLDLVTDHRLRSC